jgi:hypothetical protein
MQMTLNDIAVRRRGIFLATRNGLAYATEKDIKSAGGSSSMSDRVIRSKVGTVQADIRSMATALEAYYVDHNALPPSDVQRNIRKRSLREPRMPSFANYALTTPVAYLSCIITDGFSAGNQPFVYHVVDNRNTARMRSDPWNTGAGYLLLSPGPDGRFDIDWRIYDPSVKNQPQPEFVMRAYDPTNGVMSKGDIFRVR